MYPGPDGRVVIELDPARGGVRSHARRRDFLATGATTSASVALSGALVRTAASAAPPAPAGPTVCEIPGIGQFAILSYSWDANAGTIGSGSKVHGVSFVKLIDSFSSELCLVCVRGDQFATASLTVPGTNGNSLRYQMTHVLVSTYVPSPDTNAGDPTEHVSLSFARLQVCAVSGPNDQFRDRQPSPR